ncbi:MAG: sulfotransferase family 2 domain-containing protein [Candidatus Thorarchaeota archaeon]|jgi:hypothetical protein
MAWFMDKIRKVIFIHVPKTGGKTIAHVDGAFDSLLSPGSHRNNHRSAKWLLKLLGDEFYEYYKIGSVREPYERMASIRVNDRRADDYGPFINYLKERDLFGAKTQWSWVCDNDGSVMVDYLGRFEKYDELIEVLCEKLDIPRTSISIPHLGKIRHKVPWPTQYDQESLDFVNKKYSLDFSLFGYEKCETIEELLERPVNETKIVL